MKKKNLKHKMNWLFWLVGILFFLLLGSCLGLLVTLFYHINRIEKKVEAIEGQTPLLSSIHQQVTVLETEAQKILKPFKNLSDFKDIIRGLLKDLLHELRPHL